MIDNTVEPIVVSALKPGIYTSEFWLSLGVTVASLLGALGVANADEPVRVVFAAVAVIVPAVYSAVRTLIKRG